MHRTQREVSYIVSLKKKKSPVLCEAHPDGWPLASGRLKRVSVPVMDGMRSNYRLTLSQLQG